MPLLLDSQVFILAMRGQMSSGHYDLVTLAAENETPLTVSVASLWEISIKTQLGKLDIPVAPADTGNLARTLGFEVLPVLEAHAVAELWEAPPTNDPFDRLLLAVAQVERMKLVTLDRALMKHPLAYSP